MHELEAVMATLQERHQRALKWFIGHQGSEQFWPTPLPDGTFLATRAKGIYKPQWMGYALSVHQTLKSPYPDREPVRRADGTWVYPYFQENTDPKARDDEYTNKGLIACMRDEIPIGVMRQVSDTPRVRYEILGLALVAGWEDGFFFLEGFSPAGLSRGCGSSAEIDVILSDLSQGGEIPPFNPDSSYDRRRRIVASIVQRQGQGAFRQCLLEAYANRCAVTDCDVVETLEAAHILPYRGLETNHPANGLLLRGDLHTLFDLGLMFIDTASMTVRLAPKLLDTSYGELMGRRLWVPEEPTLRPSQEALDHHRQWAETGVK